MERWPETPVQSPRHVGHVFPGMARRRPASDFHTEHRESLGTPELGSHSEVTHWSQIYPTRSRITPEDRDLPQEIANQLDTD